MQKMQENRQKQRQPNSVLTSDMKMASLTSLEKVKHLRTQLQQDIGAYHDNNEENQFEHTDYQPPHYNQYQQRGSQQMKDESYNRHQLSPPRYWSIRDQSPNRRHSSQQPAPSQQQRPSRPQRQQQQRSAHFLPRPPPAAAVDTQVQEKEDDNDCQDDDVGASTPTEASYHRTELDRIDEGNHDDQHPDEEATEQAAVQDPDYFEEEEEEEESALLPPFPKRENNDSDTTTKVAEIEAKQQSSRSIETQITSPSSTRKHTALANSVEELLPSPAPVSKPTSSVSPRPQQQSSFGQQQQQTRGRSPSPAQVPRSFLKSNYDDDEVDLSGNWIRPREQSSERLYPDVGDEDDDYDYDNRRPAQRQEQEQYSRPPIRGEGSAKSKQHEIHIHNNNYHPSGIPAPPLIEYDRSSSSSRYSPQHRSSPSPLRGEKTVVRYNNGTDTLRDSIDFSGLSLHVSRFSLHYRYYYLPFLITFAEAKRPYRTLLIADQDSDSACRNNQFVFIYNYRYCILN